MLTEKSIKTVLEMQPAPFTDTTLGALNAVRRLSLQPDGRVEVHLTLGYPIQSNAQSIRETVHNTLLGIKGVTDVTVKLETKIVAHQVQPGVTLLPCVKNILAIASGKGGVGKSTTAVNLALALHAEGARVGLFDADIHGPSLPHMLGVSPHALDNLKEIRFPPIHAHGLQLMSMGLLVDADTPMIWRGPMVTQVFEQLIRNTVWDNLDYLVIDMPPGTGDVQLTLAQRIPLTGVVIVTTPQTVAELDAARCLQMFQKLHIPILGIIENMSTFCCPHCHKSSPLFGTDNEETLSTRYHTELLATMPWNASVNRQLEEGRPKICLGETDGITPLYLETARKIAVKMAKLPKDSTSKFPKIVVENQ